MSYYEDSTSSGVHFMGAVVSIPAKTVPVGVTKHLVIDGQQRLTTVALVMCALRDVCEDKRAAQIQDHLVNRHYADTLDYPKLLPTQGDRPAYLSIINGDSYDDAKHQMIECYNYFKKKIGGTDDNGNPIDPERILEIVKSQLQVVMINLGEADDPHLIFESLNFKGQPLSQSDLIRNYILMRFRSALGEEGEQERIYKQIWHPMESRLGSDLDSFLWHYAIKSGSADVKKPRVYTAVKDSMSTVSTDDEIRGYLEGLNKDSLNYKRFLDPKNEPRPAIRKELMLLSRLEATISYPILLKLFSACDNGQFSEDILSNCLRYINSLIVRRTVCDEKRSALNKVFARIPSRLPSESPHVDTWLAAELENPGRSERWPDDNEFRQALQYSHLYRTKAARIVLDGIEAFLAGKEVVDLSSSRITMEHIMPQTLTDSWRLEIGDEEVYAKYLNTLGNLTLTGINSELGNRSFADKKIDYAKSGIAMNRDISKYDRWSLTEIEERARMLSDLAVKLWPKFSK